MPNGNEVKQEEKNISEKSIAMEMLGELQAQNKRLASVIKWLLILIGLIVGGFLLYLYQYDFSGSIEQSGVYTLVDSSGNVISSDITPEQMEDILKIINGENKDNKKAN